MRPSGTGGIDPAFLQSYQQLYPQRDGLTCTDPYGPPPVMSETGELPPLDIRLDAWRRACAWLEANLSAADFKALIRQTVTPLYVFLSPTPTMAMDAKPWLSIWEKIGAFVTQGHAAGCDWPEEKLQVLEQVLHGLIEVGTPRKNDAEPPVKKLATITQLREITARHLIEKMHDGETPRMVIARLCNPGNGGKLTIPGIGDPELMHRLLVTEINKQLKNKN
jgi:hypothetical protein